MGKINPNKKSFCWKGTAKNLREILFVQKLILKGDAIARRLAKKIPLTLEEYLQKVY